MPARPPRTVPDPTRLSPAITAVELRALAMEQIARLGTTEVGARRAVDGRLGGQRQGLRQGGGVEFAEHRDYAPGDDLRRLDWRAFARNDRLYIKLFEEEVHTSVLLVVDASASMAMRDAATTVGGRTPVDKWRQVQVLAAVLALLIGRQGDALGLQVCGDDGPAPRVTSGPAQVSRVLARIAALQPDGAAALPELAAHSAVARCSVVIVLSDLLTDPKEAIAPLARMRRAGPDVLLLHALHPVEQTFDFGQAVELYCEERGTRMRVEPRVVRQRYLAMMAAHQDALRQRCLDAGIRYDMLDLGEPASVELRRALGGLQRGRR